MNHEKNYLLKLQKTIITELCGLLWTLAHGGLDRECEKAHTFHLNYIYYKK